MRTVLHLALLLPLWAADASAQEVAGPDQAAPMVLYPPLLEGTLSADGDQKAADEEATRSPFPRDSVLEPWLAYKQRLQQRTGLTIGGSWGLLYQNYSSSRVDEHQSTGSKFTLNLAYDLFRRNSPEALTFAMAVEDRRPVFGSDLAPLFAGFAAGSATPTAATWGDFDVGVTQAYIRQNLFGNRFQYTIGKIFAPNFVNAYPFFDDNRQFLNQQFSTSPTIQTPLRGFGMVAAYYPTASGLYLQSGVYTARSDDTGSTIDDFFNTSERFYHFDIGYSGRPRAGLPIEARGPTDSDNVHLTSWYRDAQADGTPRSYGFAFNANWMVGDSAMVFVRGGWSQDWALKRSVSTGVGWRPGGAPSDLVGVGIGWTEPESSFLRSQYTAEVFYRFHITRNLAITPDLQAVIDPSTNPDTSILWVASVRARVTF
ncbi:MULTISPECIES: carbohydrate porin [Stenotrophomonas]|uniref:carbohydrate porin n=1 Tax=Stenotrophomonas TaxID=40323 RepID=UPI00159F6BFD|nr:MULTISPECIES: carbohydrate porin [Stenotrophomonas]